MFQTTNQLMCPMVFLLTTILYPIIYYKNLQRYKPHIYPMNRGMIFFNGSHEHYRSRTRQLPNIKLRKGLKGNPSQLAGACSEHSGFNPSQKTIKWKESFFQSRHARITDYWWLHQPLKKYACQRGSSSHFEVWIC